MRSRISGFLAVLMMVLLGACGRPATGSTTAFATFPSPVTPIMSTASATAKPRLVLPPPTATGTPSPVPTEGIPELQDSAIQRQIDQLASWFLDQGTNPGLAVAIAKRDPQSGKLSVMMLDYGTIGKGEGQQVTPDTVFEIGSITKVFTGILLAQHVESGTVHLDDPIQNYLPDGIEAPTYKGKSITLLDLATHRSGLPRDLESDNIPDLYNWLSHYRLSRAPGAEYAYSNAGYALLGDIIVRPAGTDFNTLENQSVSQPLGLPDTAVMLDAEQSSRLAQGYTYDGSPAQDMPDSGALSSAGYLRSTLRDMTRFLIENMQPDASPLSESLQMAQTLQAEGPNPGTGTGLGWEIDRVGTKDERLYKGGVTYGFSSYISLQRDGSFGFVLLTNGMYAENLVPHILSILRSTP